MSNPESDREHIVFGRSVNWEDEAELGTLYFHSVATALGIDTGYALIDEGHVDPQARHNGSATIRELLNYIEMLEERYAGISDLGLTGFMVSPDRCDTRISIDGFAIRCDELISDELKQEVVHWDPHTADRDPDIVELSIDGITIRWD